MRIHLSLIILIMSVALVACGGDNVEDEVVSLVTPPIVQPTDTPLPTDTPTPLPVVVEKVDSAETPTPTLEPTPTPEPTPTETPIPVTLAQSVELEWIIGGYARPLYLTHAGDERLFIVEQQGVVYAVLDGQQLPGPFLDIRDRVNNNANERGLLSIAFHPDYPNNGRFFVYYTDASGAAVISEFAVSDDPNVALANSERQLLRAGQPYENHNGGHLLFGPDGYLYAGFGDGGSQGDPQNNGQNAESLLGSIIRIDIDNGELYAIPADNPFVADDSARNEIWSIGWRNPWRITFDRATGDMYVADVGQNLIEEVSFEVADSSGGLNYGWNVMEGSSCYLSEACDRAGKVLPIIEYTHAAGGCSITGGYVYRGAQSPALWGNYLYVDYCFGDIFAAANVDGEWQTRMVLPTEMIISSFGEDAAGELYVMDHVNGNIYRIVNGN